MKLGNAEENAGGYAGSMFTDFELHLEFKQNEVWNAPATPDGTVFSPDRVYWRDLIARTGRTPVAKAQSKGAGTDSGDKQPGPK